MKRRLLLAGAAALPAVTMFTAARAQTGAQTGGVDEEKLPALMGGDFATATSELAQSRATNPAVKAFAQLEIAEQAAVATAFGSTPGAAGLSEAHAQMLAELEAAEGEAFDRLYIEGQIAGHTELRGIHQSYAQSGADPMARGASMVGVPGIDTHLSILQSIQSSLA